MCRRRIIALLCVAAWRLCAPLPPVGAAMQRDPLCGGYCTFLALKSLDLDVGDWEEFAARLGRPTSAGFSFGKLAEVVAAFGGHTLAVETDLATLEGQSDRFACVAHLDGHHYVLLYDVAPGLVRLIDAPHDYEISAAAFEQRWDGRALLIAREPIVLSPKRSWRWSWIIGLVAVSFVLAATYMRIRRKNRDRISSVA